MCAYLENMFAAKIVKQGGVLYRRVSEVRFHRCVEQLHEQVRLRGFHMFEHGGYFIICCGTGPMIMHH